MTLFGLRDDVAPIAPRSFSQLDLITKLSIAGFAITLVQLGFELVRFVENERDRRKGH